jgi:hypothetical protein
VWFTVTPQRAYRLLLRLDALLILKRNTAALKVDHNRTSVTTPRLDLPNRARRVSLDARSFRAV